MKNKKDTSPQVSQGTKLYNTLDIKPFQWTERQKEFIQLATHKDTKIIMVSGPAGSAKTLLATFAALTLISQKRISDIIYVRSAVESADSKLGYLPGEVKDKMSYYGVPFFDKMEELLPKNDINTLIKDNRISIVPVNYVRGLSWNARCIIVDEAQNLTEKELITVMTRIGKFSKCYVLADPMQSDINGKSGGFSRISKLFDDKESKEMGIHYFEFKNEDILRSDLVKFLVTKFTELKK